MIQAGLTTISGRLFPETRQLDLDAETGNDELTITNTEVASSLPLQMCLYFNLHYSIFWGLLTLALMLFKENYLNVNTAYLILSPLLLSVWFLVEPFRIFFGYVGNLQEKVPQLTGFWLLTLIPQLPISFFFIVALPLQWSGENAATKPMQLPFDRAGSIVMLIFNLSEAIVGYHALRRMVKSQVLKFHMQHARDEASGHVHPDRSTGAVRT